MFVANFEPKAAPNPSCCTSTSALCATCASLALSGLTLNSGQPSYVGKASTIPLTEEEKKDVLVPPRTMDEILHGEGTALAPQVLSANSRHSRSFALFAGNLSA